MNKQRGFILVRVFMLVIIAAFALLFYVAYTEAEEWDEYKAAHSCRVVSHIKGSVVPTVGMTTRGKLVAATSVVPDKTGWLCDDGVTYYR